MKTILSFLLTALLLVSCNPNRVFSDRIEFAEMAWDMNDIVKFNVEIEDETIPYDIKIDLRTVDYYQYSNLWLYINTESPSKKTKADTLECILYDDKGFSESINKMRFGELEDYELSFKENVKFSEKGTYTFYLQHGMRTDKLPFINEIGLIIEKHKN